MVNGKSQRVSSAVVYGSLLLVGVSIIGDGHKTHHEETTLPAGDTVLAGALRPDLSDGDLVFRTGRDLVSRVVLSQTDAPRFSHVGIVVKIDDDTFVVHAVPKDANSFGGVVIEPLTRFASSENAVDIAFYRLKTSSQSSRDRIRQHALQQLGKPFDDAFLLSESARLYCTELVLNSFAAAGFDIAPTVPSVRAMLLTESVIPPDYLRLSPLFKVLDSHPVFEESGGISSVTMAGFQNR